MSVASVLEGAATLLAAFGGLVAGLRAGRLADAAKAAGGHSDSPTASTACVIEQRYHRPRPHRQECLCHPRSGLGGFACGGLLLFLGLDDLCDREQFIALGELRKKAERQLNDALHAQGRPIREVAELERELRVQAAAFELVATLARQTPCCTPCWVSVGYPAAPHSRKERHRRPWSVGR